MGIDIHALEGYGENMSTYTPPSHNSEAFNCPLCGAFAHQIWYDGFGSKQHVSNVTVYHLTIARCQHCNQFSLWLSGEMIYPLSTGAPLPNSDLPSNVKADYEEASKILTLSPRGSAALLRLGIQELCVHLGEKGKDLNDDIANLVRKGLPEKIQKALDVVRVVGNNAVHPGQMDLKDDTQIARQLFDLVNIIADVMIGQPKRIEAMYSKLPQTQKDAITKRDK
jgi:hypothetical protein